MNLSAPLPMSTTPVIYAANYRPIIPINSSSAIAPLMPLPFPVLPGPSIQVPSAGVPLFAYNGTLVHPSIFLPPPNPSCFPNPCFPQLSPKQQQQQQPKHQQQQQQQQQHTPTKKKQQHRIHAEQPPPAPIPCNCLVTVSFKRNSLVFTSKLKFNVGDFVVVEADRGEHIGVVADCVPQTEAEALSSMEIDLPGPTPQISIDSQKQQDADSKNPSQTDTNNSDNVLPCVLRRATEAEKSKLAILRGKEQNAIEVARKHAMKLGAEIDIVDVEYQFDKHKITITYESDTVVDFRKLQRRLHSKFKCRVWLENSKQVEVTEQKMTSTVGSRSASLSDSVRTPSQGGDSSE